MLKTTELPHALTEGIIKLAGGNPFFIEEVVRSLFEKKAIVRRDWGFEVTKKVDEILQQIPDTIKGVLGARIGLLKEETRDLLKVASVIGRSFSYRILSDVASEVNDIEGKLAYLSEIQLLQPQERMGDVEYLFKHALTQEVAYESLPKDNRKKLHLRVAHSIENIFSGSLPECYGMLAYHYSCAEDLEKTEEYLIKAGEEALRSAASDEALHHYEQALQLYLKKSGKHADPEKVAMLQKNIGFALFNRGHYAEAVEHFDKALNYYWGELPKNALLEKLWFASSFITFIPFILALRFSRFASRVKRGSFRWLLRFPSRWLFILSLRFPSRWFKKLPTQQDIEAVDLFYKKGEALVVINPKRFLIESFFYYRIIVHFDLTRFKLGFGILAAASALFSFTGLSLGTGRRILDYVKPKLVPDDAKQWIVYDLTDTQHNFLKGRWDEIAECNDDLVNRYQSIGEVYYGPQHYYWHGLAKIFQGHFDAAKGMVTKLSEIAEVYENDIYRLLKYLLNIHLLIECRHLKEAMAEVSRGIDLVQRNGWVLSTMNMHSLKALIHLLKKETEGAGESLDKANQIRSKLKAAPMQLSHFYRSQFEYYLRCLEDSLRNGHRHESSEYRRNAFKSGRKLIRTCRKAALYRTESYRLMGVYNWLIRDQKNAFKWWQKASSEGESLGARSQIARTYAEMGMRLCAVKGGSSEPDVSRAEAYLQKAKTMFSELGLHHDLEDLNSMIDRIGLKPSKVRSSFSER